MFKKISYFILLILLLITFSFSLYFNLSFKPFNASNVKMTIGVLSSSTYSGRLPGTDGNALVGEIIKKKFQDSKLIPLNDTYEENFKTLCPVSTNTKPYLNISKDNLVIEELIYGVDFKEDMLNFRNNSITFNNKDTVNFYGNSIDVTSNGKKCLFYVAKGGNFSFRSSFMSDFKYDMMILINTNTYNKILDSLREDKEISIHLPYTTEEKELSNIVGVLKGSSENLPPLVFTAHYDHLGQDGLGNTYYGALDNASGTSFLLELQKSLSSYAKPKRDIIFVGLNAEEFGLLGSKAFAEKNSALLKNAEVINFDMIGATGYPITFMKGARCRDTNSELLNSVKALCAKLGVKYDVTFQDCSDHASFNNLGIDSLSLSHSDMSKIHTPNDTVDYISEDAILDAYSIIENKILASSYSPLNIFFHSKYLFIISGSLLLLISAYPLFIKSKVLKNK